MRRVGRKLGLCKIKLMVANHRVVTQGRLSGELGKSGKSPKGYWF